VADRPPRVTVLLPVHNDRRFVGRAVASILAQTFRDFELVVLNDASTDGSMDVVEGFRDARLRIVRNASNIGLARTLNVGLAAAEGELVARMDADDISEPTRFERQVAFLDANPAVALVGTWARWIDEDDRPFTTIRFPTDAAEIERSLLEENCIFHPSVMFRRRPIQALGGYSIATPLSQDYDLWLRLSERHALANLPEFLVRYRIHREQVSFRKIGLQRSVANVMRYEAAVRRHRAGQIADPAPYAPPGLAARLRGRNGSTGAALAFWAQIYRKMGRRSDALAIAALACAHSPFGGEGYAGVKHALREMFWSPAVRRRFGWYATRVRSILARLTAARRR
jgi:glycosyltransferase involved in cell wall biosynthesis